ncbi:hypothetical protein V2J09_008087 [Rumex salicifolius]
MISQIMRSLALLGFFTVLLSTIVRIDAAAHRRRSSGQDRDRIGRLPGQPSGVNFSQYAGYVTVDQKAGRSLFYWLIESTNKPNIKPIVLWLNGGPGCSSIGYGASEEVGPFRARPDGKTLSLSPFAWNKEANLLFLDSPAGVGFSYSNTSSDLHDVGDRRSAGDAYLFLVNWLKKFPQYRNRPFYIAGESYAGHYIPELAQVIANHNRGVKNPTINLKGLLLGNPLLDDHYDNKGSFEHWWTHGLISDSTYHQLNKWCQNVSFLFPTGRCSYALIRAYSEFGDVNPYDIYGDVCAELGTASLLRTHLRKPLPFKYRGNDECVTAHTKKYMNRLDVQRALHVESTKVSHPWRTCSDVVRGSWKDSRKTMLPVLRDLIAAGLRIWVYSGDTDAVIPLTSTRYSINAMNLKVLTQWYAWYDQHKVGGWSQIYKGLTLVTVRGAGHEVPLGRPRLASVLFRHFLDNVPLPSVVGEFHG